MKKMSFYIFKFYRKHFFKISLYFFIGFIITVNSIIFPYINGKFVDLFTSKYITMNKVINYVILIFILSIVNSFLSYFKGIGYAKLTSKINYDIINFCLCKFYKMKLRFIEKYDYAYISQRISEDSDELVHGVFSLIGEFLANSIILLSCIIILGKFDLILLLVMLILCFFCIVIYKFSKKFIYDIKKKSIESQSIFFSNINLQIKNIKYIKIHNLQVYFKNFLFKSFDVLYKNIIKNQKLDFFYSYVNSFLGLLVQIFILIYGGYEIINNKLTIGEFTLLSIFYNKLLSSLSSFFEFGKKIQYIKTNFDRLSEFLNLEEERFGNEIIKNIENIEVKNLSFGFKDKIFKNLELHFEKGNIYVIYGSNGCGKSTFLDILLGFYNDKIDGDIFFNDVHIRNVDFNFLRKNTISFLSQKLEIIDFLPLDSNLYDFSSLKDLSFEFLIDKYFYVEKEEIKFYRDKNEAKNLSGGEIQKIFLAFVLSKKVSLILLDEPTSAIDKTSKDILFNNLKKLKKDKIILIVTHDKEFLNISDYVIHF